jgi:UDP-glucose 4-epimerase
MRCLVTGGAGFIGSHLAEALVTSGHHVCVLDDCSTGQEENLLGVRDRITFLRGSVTDRQFVETAVRGSRWVFHLAALPSVQRSIETPSLTHEVCATGTLNVLEASRRLGVSRVVYAASSSAYGDTPGTVRSEDDPSAPLSPYAVAKLAGEHYCRSFTKVYGLETVRLRFFNVFGPRQRADSPYSGVIPLFIAAMAAGRRPTVYGDGLQSRDFTYVSNVVQALVKAARAPAAPGNVYNVGNGGTTSVLELIEQLNRLLGTRVRPEFSPSRAGDVRHSQANIERAQGDLGYRPRVSFAEGLALTVQAFRSGGSSCRRRGIEQRGMSSP